MNIENIIAIFSSPTSLSVWINILMCIALSYYMKFFPYSKFTLFVELIFEKVYDFFIDILWEKEKKSILMYVLSLFFIILLFNIQGIIIEFIAPVMWFNQAGWFLIEHYIVPASADINFNIAMSCVSILLVIAVQFSSFGVKDFFMNYFPVTGKWYLTIERWEKSKGVYFMMMIPVKIFDIIISLFLGILEFVGLGAKIVSLSFRLFGNMTSGTVLLWMTVVAMSGMTNDLFGFSFPVVIPVFIYMQEMLIGVIQALVFSLLIAIFIKVARVS